MLTLCYISEDPAVLVFSLPLVLIHGTPTRFAEHLTCTADMGYPGGSIRDLRIEYKLDTETVFQTFTLKAPLNSDSSTAEGPCALNKTLAYNMLTFTGAYNNSVFRCSVYESAQSTTSLVSSQELPLQLLPSKYILSNSHAHTFVLLK